MTRQSTLGLSALLSAAALAMTLTAVSPAQARSGEGVDRFVHSSAGYQQTAKTHIQQTANSGAGVFSDVFQSRRDVPGKLKYRRTRR